MVNIIAMSKKIQPIELNQRTVYLPYMQPGEKIDQSVTRLLKKGEIDKAVRLVSSAIDSKYSHEGETNRHAMGSAIVELIAGVCDKYPKDAPGELEGTLSSQQVEDLLRYLFRFGGFRDLARETGDLAIESGFQIDKQIFKKAKPRPQLMPTHVPMQESMEERVSVPKPIEKEQAARVVRPASDLSNLTQISDLDELKDLLLEAINNDTLYSKSHKYGDRYARIVEDRDNVREIVVKAIRLLLQADRFKEAAHLVSRFYGYSNNKNIGFHFAAEARKENRKRIRQAILAKVDNFLNREDYKKAIELASEFSIQDKEADRKTLSLIREAVRGKITQYRHENMKKALELASVCVENEPNIIIPAPNSSYSDLQRVINPLLLDAAKAKGHEKDTVDFAIQVLRKYNLRGMVIKEVADSAYSAGKLPAYGQLVLEATMRKLLYRHSFVVDDALVRLGDPNSSRKPSTISYARTIGLAALDKGLEIVKDKELEDLMEKLIQKEQELKDKTPEEMILLLLTVASNLKVRPQQDTNYSLKLINIERAKTIAKKHEVKVPVEIENILNVA